MNLEDFSHLLTFKKPKLEKEQEELKRIYENRLKEIKKEFEERLSKENKAAYEKGFTEGMKKAREEAEKEIEKLRRNYDETIAEKELNVEKLHAEFKSELERKVLAIKSTILDALEEILEFLYISEKNAKYLKDIIEGILDEFKEIGEIELEVGENLKDLIKEAGNIKVKVERNLNPSDFRIKFPNFTVESKLKDKLKILREELEREIKKSS